jgi:ABC-2 type transport system permease protein
MLRILSEIHRGTLDFALVKPVDDQVLVSLRELHFWSLTDVVVGLVVINVAILQMQQQIGLWQALGFTAALVFGGMIIYCFWLMLTSVGFWAVRIDALVELFEGIYSTGRWPVSIYPDWLRVGLTFLVPVAFAVTIPAEALTNRLTPVALLGEAGLALLFFALARLVWKLGVRNYSGASA